MQQSKESSTEVKVVNPGVMPPINRSIMVKRKTSKDNEGGVQPLLGSSGAVSYTHLDVYKRQEYENNRIYISTRNGEM